MSFFFLSFLNTFGFESVQESGKKHEPAPQKNLNLQKNCVYIHTYLYPYFTSTETL